MDPRFVDPDASKYPFLKMTKQGDKYLVEIIRDAQLKLVFFWTPCIRLELEETLVRNLKLNVPHVDNFRVPGENRVMTIFKGQQIFNEKAYRIEFGFDRGNMVFRSNLGNTLLWVKEVHFATRSPPTPPQLDLRTRTLPTTPSTIQVAQKGRPFANSDEAGFLSSASGAPPWHARVSSSIAPESPYAPVPGPSSSYSAAATASRGTLGGVPSARVIPETPVLHEGHYAAQNTNWGVCMGWIKRKLHMLVSFPGDKSRPYVTTVNAQIPLEKGCVYEFDFVQGREGDVIIRSQHPKVTAETFKQQVQMPRYSKEHFDPPSSQEGAPLDCKASALNIRIVQPMQPSEADNFYVPAQVLNDRGDVQLIYVRFLKPLPSNKLKHVCVLGATRAAPESSPKDVAAFDVDCVDVARCFYDFEDESLEREARAVEERIWKAPPLPFRPKRSRKEEDEVKTEAVEKGVEEEEDEGEDEDEQEEVEEVRPPTKRTRGRPATLDVPENE